CVGHHLNRRVEPEGDVGPADVIVDGLGDADDPDPLLLEPSSRAEASVAADDDQRVDATRFDGGPDRLVALTVDVGVEPGAAQDGPAPAEDPADTVTGERTGHPLHQSLPALLHADHLPALGDETGHHAANGGVGP